MSFSMPTTSQPASARCPTDSDPIRPPEPLTTATATIGLASRGPDAETKRFGDQVLVSGDPCLDVAQRVLGAAPRPPVAVLEQARAVRQVDRDVSLPLLGHGL